MPAGYSGTPLVKKLGLRAGHRARVVDAPDHYLDLLGTLPGDVTFAKTTRGAFDFIHLFSTRAADLRRRLPTLRNALEPDGLLWISWPKKTSSIASDLDGNGVRAIGLDAGLVDVKVCAVDEDWSGLKFVYRKRDR